MRTAKRCSKFDTMKRASRNFPNDLPLKVVAALLGALALFHLGRGVRYAAFDSSPYVPSDLRLRWQEQHYVFRGKNPYEVFNQFEQFANGGERPRPEAAVDPDLGKPSPGYPPWSYATGALLVWPDDWTLAKRGFALLELLLLAYVARFAYRLGMKGGTALAWFASMGTLAFGSFGSTLVSGQYGIVVLAALVGVLQVDGRGKGVLQGLLLGVALVKPTLSLPFVVPLLIRRRAMTLLVASAYITCGSCLTWVLTGADPWTMLEQTAAATRHWGLDQGADLISTLVRLGVESKLAAKVAAGGSLAALLILAVRYRKESLLTQFAVAGLASRLWIYHRAYDDVILAFLLLALINAWRERKSVATLVAVVLAGATLWAPTSASRRPVLDFAMIVVWTAGLAVLLAGSDLRKRIGKPSVT